MFGKTLLSWLCALFGSLICDANEPNNKTVTFEPQVYVFAEDEVASLYEKAANEILATVRQNPHAVILMPTGSTPKKMYARLIQLFTEDASIDFSNVKFFVLDEYVGLPANHPLSYAFYMNHFFYHPLEKIDAKRAPKKVNRFVPKINVGETPAHAAKVYAYQLAKAIERNKTGKIDLAVLGIGAAHPEKTHEDITIMKGGHIAFNEPGSSRNHQVRVINLSPHTRKSIKHRYQALGHLQSNGLRPGASFTTDVPTQAITIGVAEILKAAKVMVLATGEAKAPVIEHVFSKNITPHFPATYLNYHPNTVWLLDDNASGTSQYHPWFNREQKSFTENPEHWICQGVCVASLNQNKPISDIVLDDLALAGMQTASPVEKNMTPENNKHLAQVQNKLLTSLREKTEKSSLPNHKTILIISPHPDDDVISMGATIKQLSEAGNDIHIMYVTPGYNSVREDLKSYQKIYAHLKERYPLMTEKDLVIEAKTRVREFEASMATSRFRIPAEKLTYFRAEFYNQRGIPGFNPISHRDMVHMQEALLKIQPDFIFFAAESDPNGAHGLSSQLVANVVNEMTDEHFKNITFVGYRGAYNEWSAHIPERLWIVPYDKATLLTKLQSIKDHVSQLIAEYPSFDARPFYQRAWDRNAHSAKSIEKLINAKLVNKKTGEPTPYAEIFKTFDRQEFIKLYG